MHPCLQVDAAWSHSWPTNYIRAIYMPIAEGTVKQTSLGTPQLLREEGGGGGGGGGWFLDSVNSVCLQCKGTLRRTHAVEFYESAQAVTVLACTLACRDFLTLAWICVQLKESPRPVLLDVWNFVNLEVSLALTYLDLIELAMPHEGDLHLEYCGPYFKCIFRAIRLAQATHKVRGCP